MHKRVGEIVNVLVYNESCAMIELIGLVPTGISTENWFDEKEAIVHRARDLMAKTIRESLRMC